MIHNFYLLVNGSSLSLPANGRAGQGQRSFAAYFAKRNTNLGGGEKARAGREFLSPQPPFLPAPPERKSFLLCRPAEGGSNQNSQSGFSSKNVRILSKRYRQFSEFGFWAIVASPRQRRGSASAVILKGNLKSKNNFCPLKRKFAVRSTDKTKFCKPIFFLSPMAKDKAIISNILTA
jgi:hypothetical protein